MNLQRILQKLNPHAELLRWFLVIGGFYGLLMLAAVPNSAALLIVVCLAWKGPEMVQARRLAKRLNDFDLSLSDGLLELSASLRAGINLQDSLAAFSKSSSTPFALMLREVLLEQALGQELKVSLKRLIERSRSDNAHIAIGALIVAYELGGNLSEILQRIAQTMREKDRVEGRLKTLTAQGRMQGYLLASAPVVICVLMALFDAKRWGLLVGTKIGLVFLGLAMVLELIGIYATSRLLKLNI